MNIETYKLKIPGVIEVSFLNLGGIIQKILVPDVEGNMDDVVLGFGDPEDYRKEHPCFGALVGPYANRIRGGRFNLNEKTYRLTVNEGKNTLHGGRNGFDKVFWEVKKNLDGNSYSLKHVSPHMHEGFPGELTVEVTYTITRGGELVIDYKATTDLPTPINLTNHSYFNLSGSKESDISEHEAWINADSYTELDRESIPTGKILSIDGAKDFREHKKIREGFDLNYVLNEGPIYDPKARLIHPPSGRMMEVFTTEPGVQFYTVKNAACFETQHFPDSPNHPNFPSTILSPGAAFYSKTIYKFTA